MDKLARRAFKTGAWLFVGIFVGHTMGQLATDFGTPTPEQAELYAHMGRVLGMEGSSHSVLDFDRGSSYGMGFMYLAFGALLLLVARTFDKRNEPYPRPVIGFAFVVALLSLALAIAFFPVPPISFFAVATLAFAVCFARTPAA